MTRARGDGHPLLLPTGQGAGIDAGLVCEADLRECLMCVLDGL